MVDAYPSLLVTKVHVPRIRPTQVRRERLLALLDSGLERRLILIAAAAGFGKTSLLAEWSTRHEGQICWLSLDEADNEPARFAAYLIAALQSRRPEIGRELLAALQSPQPPTVENVLAVLINQLADIPERLIVVLDDYHVIENPAVHSALSFLLSHAPPTITLVMLTRSDPPLALARLRAKHDLLELRADALRFSAEEAADFLNAIMGLDLSAEAVNALESRTEGWIAGLQLVALALHNNTTTADTFIREFTGTHRFILDYLIEEVLSRQPEPVQRFLIDTAILHRLSAGLCDAVTGETNGRAMLDILERNNLFLIPLDASRRWYRYHHLFADLLQARFLAEDAAQRTERYRRAAHWHAENNLPEEAVRYALAARDFEVAAQLITGPAAGASTRGEINTLLEWYRTFPPDFVAERMTLSLHFGLAFALNGRWAEAGALLDAIERHQNAETLINEALPLAFVVANMRRDNAKLAVLAAHADQSVQSEPLNRIMGALIIGSMGDHRRASQRMIEAERANQGDGNTLMALLAMFHLCRLQVFAGDLTEAFATCQRALQYIRETGGAALPLASFVYSALGRIYIEWNQPDEAEHYLQQALRLGEDSGFLTGMLSSSAMMMAEVKQARGDTSGAIEAMEAAVAIADRHDPAHEAALLRVYGARIWLTQGQTEQAAEWLRAMQRHPGAVSMFYPGTIQMVTQARLLLAQRRTDAAINVLTSVTALPHHLLTVEALVALAMARQIRGDSGNALLTLENALNLATPDRRVRAFLELAHPTLSTLLAQYCELHPDHRFARELLAALPTTQAPASSAIEPLGERERDVLRLIVAGQSNEEIAQTLSLAVSTVKWYINGIYGKLHVKNRGQAIARTRDLRLL